MSLAAPPDVAEALTDLDTALPDIAGAFDSQAVGRRFAHEWRVSIARCALIGARYEPGVRCTTTYELLVVDGTGSESRTFGVVDLTPQGRCLRRFDEDEALPGLAAAVDPNVMGRRLATVCSVPVASCTATLVRYRPRERAVLRYGLTTTRDGPIAVFGKTCAGAPPPAATLAALHEAAASDPAAPLVPATIATFDDLNLVIQVPADGDLLHARAFTSSRVDTDLVARFRRTGRALAAFHDRDGPPAPRRTLAADVDEVRACLPAVHQVDSELGARLAAVADLATTACTHESNAEDAPGHGSMRTDHVHTSTRVTFIDLDGYCRSDRARDIGNFLAYLRWKALRQHQYRMVVADSRQAFRAGYTRAGHVPAEDIVRTAEAVSLLKIAGRRFRSLSVREWPQVPALVDAALKLLSGAPT